MSEKFALKWNDFQTNWNNSLSKLRKETDFADVTLISDDKVKFSAHKILLSSCSNVFKFILKEHHQPHPLLYLGGVSSINIGFILDYMYFGEVNIYQEQLDSFLEAAQKLEISGLIGDNQDIQEKENHSFKENLNYITERKEILTEVDTLYNPSIPVDNSSSLVSSSACVVKERRQYSRAPSNDVTRIYVGNMTPEEIEATTKEMYQKIDGVWTCLKCGKTSTGMSTNIRFHVETHLDGLCYTCNICSREFRSKNLLNVHKNKHK